jgi:hypothetical protein
MMMTTIAMTMMITITITMKMMIPIGGEGATITVVHVVADIVVDVVVLHVDHDRHR